MTLSWLKPLQSRLEEPVEITSLVFFRIGFGVIMLWEVVRYFRHDWIDYLYISPPFHFKYLGFEWIHPWSEGGMYVHFFALGVSAAFIGIGLFYRFSSFLFLVLFLQVFFIDSSYYLNHFYLVALVTFILLFLPAHRAFSIDCLINPAKRMSRIPFWNLLALRIQMSFVYFFAGLAKLNEDWLIRAEPMGQWLEARSEIPVLGYFFDFEWTAHFFSWSGLLIDLTAPFLLAFPRTRIPILLVLCTFQLTNSILFRIGIFPWLAILLTLLYLPPSFPATVLRKFGHSRKSGVPESRPCFSNPVALKLLSLFFLVQVILPFRHVLYPGNVNWTEEGHRFSWRMKLREKRGEVLFLVTNPKTQETRVANPADYLNEDQRFSMLGNPEMIVQFAHYLDRLVKENAGFDPVIRVKTSISLNRRPHQPLIAPEVDLSRKRLSWTPSSWILPLQPLSSDAA